MVVSLGLMSSTPPLVASSLTPHIEVSIPLVRIAQAAEREPETIEDMITRIADEEGISRETLYNLANSESKLEANPEGHNDGGKAAGIVQIHYETWGFTKEQVLDPEFSLRFAAEHIKKGDAWKYWSPMNCYTYLKYALKVSLPKMAQIVPSSFVPVAGAVAVFNYSGNVKHVALVRSVNGRSFTVKEANFKAGLVGERTISLDDPFLAGFYYPQM